MEDSKRLKAGVFSSIVGIITNLILATTKLIVGIITLSISIIADAINNFSDLASSIINLIGFKISAKPADDGHPYGHRRMEYISGLILAVIIMAIDIELIYSSITSLMKPSKLEISIITMIIIGISIIAKALLGLFYLAMYKKTSSIALKAAALDSRNDCITTSIVLIGVIVYYINGFKYTDPICSIIVGIIILISAIGILHDAISPLLGESIDSELFKEIVNEIKRDPDILGLHDAECHVYGSSQIFMSVHAEIDGSLSLVKAHEIIDRCEDKIKSKYNVNLVIHPDPMEMDVKTISLKNKIIDILKSYNEALFLHDFHVNGNLIEFECIKPRDVLIDEDYIKSLLNEKMTDYSFKIIFEYGYINSADLTELR